MITRQRLVTYGIPTLAAATIITAALLKPRRDIDKAPPYEPVNPTPVASNGKKIDVVFAIDTTESMSGLIDGAKRTVWGIAGHIRDTNPQADIHVGLVAYRDVGDDYVTRDFQLTSDLDGMFAELSSYRAAGGDDIPEDVAAGLYDAVYKMQWRDGAKKIVFLVGDAPPASRGDVPRYDVIAREAASRDIIINTIRCGTEVPGTAEAWQEIASLGHGEYSTIAADGGVHQVATEYDAKMAEISGRIDSTTVILGADRRAAYEGKMAAAKAAPVEAQAERGAYYGAMGSGASRDDGDAVSAVANGRVTVDGIAADALPPELQHLTKDELKAEMSRRADERKALTDQLQDLKSKRAEALKGKGGGGFDAKVKETIDHQLQ
jgi:hypothetical protein